MRWITVMGAEPNNIGQLIAEMKSARLDIDTRDRKTLERMDELEASLNDILVGMRRPAGGEGHGDDRDITRKSAVQMCIDRRALANPRNEGRWTPYTPGGAEIDEALNAMKAWRNILRHGDLQRLDDIERKALSSFSFGSAGWVTPPQVSSRILSCLTDPTDVLSLFSQETISAGSIQYLAATSSVCGTLRPSDLAVLIAGRRGERRAISCAARSASGYGFDAATAPPALALQQHTKHQSVRYEQQRNDRCGNEIGGAELPWRYSGCVGLIERVE
jgi:hypothetical protein